MPKPKLNANPNHNRVKREKKRLLGFRPFETACRRGSFTIFKLGRNPRIVIRYSYPRILSLIYHDLSLVPCPNFSRNMENVSYIFHNIFHAYFLILSATDVYTAALNRGDIAGALLIEPLRTFGEREAPSMY